MEVFDGFTEMVAKKARKNMKKKRKYVKSFWGIVVGQFISLFGNSVLRYSLSLYILDITGSVSIYSLIMALTVIPQIVIAPYGGALADRVSKKKIMIILDVVTGIIVLGYGLFMMNCDISMLGLGSFICGMAVIQNIYDPVDRASLPAIVSENELASANSITQMISTAASILGPVAAGGVYGFYGIQIVLIIDGISFLISAVIELFLVIPYQKKKWEGNPLVLFSKELGQTFCYVKRKKKILLYIAYISAGLNFLIMPLYIIGVPYLEKEIFHVTNQMYGISEACIGFGVIVGAVIVAIWGKFFSIEKFHYLFIGLAIVILGMGASIFPIFFVESGNNFVSFFLLTITGFLFTLCITVSSIICTTFIQKASPESMMGKIMSLVNAFGTIFLPLGQVLFGWIYEWMGEKSFYLYAGVGGLTIIGSRIIKKIVKENGKVEM